MIAQLRVKDLSYTASGKPILTGISLEALSGEFIGLLGVNGAGKSTLLDILAGLRAPSSGAVLLNGKHLNDAPASERARWICHLPQGVRGDLPFTAEQIVLMGRYPQADRWMESEQDRDTVTDALERTHALEFRHRCFSTLSGGERQCVLLSACLAQAATIMLMDEPSTYLDLRHQIQCFELLRAETVRGAICIAVTHDLNLALAYCSRVLVLQNGALGYDLPVEEAWRHKSWFLEFSERLRVEHSSNGGSWIAYR